MAKHAEEWLLQIASKPKTGLRKDAGTVIPARIPQ